MVCTTLSIFFLTSMLEMQSLEPPSDLPKMAYLGHDIQRKKKFLYYEKYHLFISSAVTHYNYILKNSYETKVMNRLFNMI